MATKDYCLLPNNKQQTFDGGTRDRDHQNHNSINLNQNCKHNNLEIVQSQSSFSNTSNKKNNDFNDCKSVGSSVKSSSQSWKKRDNTNQDSTSNGHHEAKSGKNKRDKNSNTTNSTLSLHIKAYENSDEPQKLGHSMKAKTKQVKQITKNVQSLFVGVGSEAQNPFEFPRQQESVNTNEPEVMQFKASQKLLSSDESTESNSNKSQASDNTNAKAVEQTCECVNNFKHWSNILTTKFKNDETTDFISGFLGQFSMDFHNCDFFDDISMKIQDAIEDVNICGFTPLLVICLKANLFKFDNFYLSSARETELDELDDARLLFILKQQQKDEGDFCSKMFRQFHHLSNFIMFQQINPTIEFNSNKDVWYFVKKNWISKHLHRFYASEQEVTPILEELMKHYDSERHFMNMDAKTLQLFVEKLPSSTDISEIEQFFKEYNSSELPLDKLQDILENETCISIGEKYESLKREILFHSLSKNISPQKFMEMRPLLENLFESWKVCEIKTLFELIKTEEDVPHMKECLELLSEWFANYELCPINDLKVIPSSEWQKTIHQFLVKHKMGEVVHEFTLSELIDIIFEQKVYMPKEKLTEAYNKYLSEYNIISNKNMAEMSVFAKKMPAEWYKRLAYIIHIANLHFNIKVRDVQILAVILLHLKPENRNIILQVNTGEGKTLIYAISAVLKALDGHKIDIITSSTELADDQSTKMAPFYKIFGLTTGNNKNPLKPSTLHNFWNVFKSLFREPNEYEADIVYGTIENFKSHELQDEFRKLELKGGRKCGVAFIDEADLLMIDRFADILYLGDEVPGMFHLLPILGVIWRQVEDISGTVEKKDDKWYEKSSDNEEEEIDDIKKYYFKHISTHIKKVVRIEKPTEEKYLEIKYPIFLKDYVNNEIDLWIEAAIDAKLTMRLNCKYTLKNGKIIIIDAQNTGVLQYSSQWCHGMHQFLQMKEGCHVTAPSLSTNFKSNLSYFSLYGANINASTGTAGDQNDMEFLRKTYNTDCIVIPPFRKSKAIELRQILCDSEEQWLDTTISNCLNKIKNDQAALIICEYTETANVITKKFEENGSNVFKYSEEDESKNIQKIFQSGDVIVGTNIVGRGTDLLVSEEVNRNGGLHVCPTSPAENDRVDRQKKGRTGRSGNNGTVQEIYLEKDFSHQQWRNYFMNNEINIEQKMEKVEIDKQNNAVFKRFCNLKDKMKTDKNDEFCQRALIEKFGLWCVENQNKLSIEKFEIFEQQCLANLGEAIIENPFIMVEMAEAPIIKNELEQQKSYITKAIDADPEFLASAYYLRGYVKVLIYNKDTKKNSLNGAIDDFKKAREIIENMHYPYLDLIVPVQFGESVPLKDQMKRSKALYQTITNSLDAAIGKDVQKHIEYLENQLKNPEMNDEQKQKCENEKKDSINNREQLEKGVLREAQKNGSEVKIKTLSFNDVLPPEERKELYKDAIEMLKSNGFQNVFIFNEKTPINWGAVVGLGLIGVGQLAAGAAAVLYSMGTGAGVGYSLIRQGISDIYTLVKDVIINRNFSWETWGYQKVVSLAVDLLCAGIGAIKSAASGVVRGVKTVVNCTKESIKATTNEAFKISAKLVAKEAVESVSREVIVSLADFTLANTIEESVKEAVTKAVNKVLSYSVKNNQNIKILIECDRKNRNNKYSKKLEQYLLKLLQNDEKVFFQMGRAIKTHMEKCGKLEKCLSYIANYGELITTLAKIISFFTIYVEGIAKSEECQIDSKKEIPKCDDTVVQVKPIEITVEDFCRNLSHCLSTRIVSTVKGALVQKIGSGCVDFLFKSYSNKIEQEAKEFNQKLSNGDFVVYDAKLDFGVVATMIEDNYNTTLAGGPAESINIGILAKLKNLKIVVIDGEKEHIFGKDSEKDPIVLKLIRTSGNKVGHYELANGKILQPSGENNCFYDAIAAKTGEDANKLRKEVATFMMKNFRAVAAAQKKYRNISLCGGKLDSIEKHCMPPNQDEETEWYNACDYFYKVEKERWGKKKHVSFVEESSNLDGSKTKERTILTINGEVLSRRFKAAVAGYMEKNELTYKDFDFDFEVQINGKVKSFVTTSYEAPVNNKVAVPKFCEEYDIRRAVFTVDKYGKAIHLEYDHPNTIRKPRRDFPKNYNPDKYQVEVIKVKPPLKPRKKSV